MRVIGFDPSKTCTGVALFDGATWRTWSLKCPIKRPPGAAALDALYTGAVLAWFGNEVAAILENHQPDTAAIEAPLNTNAGGMSGQMPIQTVHLLHGIAAELCAVCFAYDVPAEYVGQGTWRKAFGVTGKGRDAKKRAAVDICRFEGIAVGSNDEAEAVGIARWLYSQRTGARPSWTNDLPLLRPSSPR